MPNQDFSIRRDLLICAILLCCFPRGAAGRVSAKDVDSLDRDLDIVQAKSGHELGSRRDTVIIFVPGILGSKLIGPGGKTVWGEGKPNTNGLAFLPGNEQLTSEILTEFKAGVLGRRFDVYGAAISGLQMAAGKPSLVKVFAYDWRQDIQTISDRLDKAIREEWRDSWTSRPNVIIVAHSMGGLVTWDWKNRYYCNGKYDFKKLKLVMVGVPLNGSCEMLRTLLHGYAPIPGSGIMEEAGYKVMFGKLRHAAMTFPSVFELLPPTDPLDDDVNACLLDEDSGSSVVRDHFSESIWQNVLGPFGDKASAHLGLSRAIFDGMLARNLGRAKEFTQTLDRSESIAGCTSPDFTQFFYSKDFPTTNQVVVKGGMMARTSTKNGDGRVLESSAENMRHASLPPLRINASHGDMVSNEGFLDWIHKVLHIELAQQRFLRGFDLASKTVEGRQALREVIGGSIPLSVLGIDPLAPKGEFEIGQLLAFNREMSNRQPVVVRMTARSPDWVGKDSLLLRTSEGDAVFFAVGRAKENGNYEDLALKANEHGEVELSKTMRDFVDFLSKGYLLSTSSVLDVNQAVANTSNSFTKLAFSSATPMDNWRDPFDGTVYSLMKVDMVSAKKAITDSQKLDPGVRAYFSANAERAFDVLSVEKKRATH